MAFLQQMNNFSQLQNLQTFNNTFQNLASSFNSNPSGMNNSGFSYGGFPTNMGMSNSLGMNNNNTNNNNENAMIEESLKMKYDSKMSLDTPRKKI